MIREYIEKSETFEEDLSGLLGFLIIRIKLNCWLLVLQLLVTIEVKLVEVKVNECVAKKSNSKSIIALDRTKD